MSAAATRDSLAMLLWRQSDYNSMETVKEQFKYIRLCNSITRFFQHSFAIIPVQQLIHFSRILVFFSAHYSMHLFLSLATLERQAVPIVHKGGTSYNYTLGYAVPTWRWLPQDCGTANCREKRGKVGTFLAFVSLQISHIVCHGS